MMENGTALQELPSWKVIAGIIFAFFFLLLGIYGTSLGNDFVRFDDGLLIYENPVVREMSMRSLKSAFTTYDPELYIPLTLLSYKFDYLIGGTNPFVYHFHNLLLHSLNAVLVLALVFLLSGSRIMAIICAVLFAVHPLHTEAVAWASARKDLLATFYFLGSLLAYMFYQRVCQLSTTHYRLPRSYLLSLFLFLLGLLSKVMVLTLPIVLLLIDWKEGRLFGTSLRSPVASYGRRGTIVLDKVPYLLLSLIFGVIALYGKRAVTAQATLFETLLMAPKSILFYLTKLFVPIKLSVLYPYTGEIALSLPTFFLPLLALAFLLAAAFVSLRWTKECFFGFLFFLLTLGPTFINFSKDGESYFASDRYAYIPSIGILYLVAWILLRAQRSKKFSILHSPFSIASALLAVALVFSVLSFRQSLVWADTETLFRNVLAHYPNAHRAHNNLGNVHRRRGELPEAIASFEAALAIRESPRTLANLGAVLRRLGRTEEAIALHERAMLLAPDDPEPHFGLGIIYAQLGKTVEARMQYERALALDPAYIDVWNNLGALAMQEGKIEEAIASYEHALKLNSQYPQAHFNLGVAFAKQGKRLEARAEYEESIALDPAFLPAQLNFGLLLVQEGETEEAKKVFEEVLRRDPANALARSALQNLGSSKL